MGPSGTGKAEVSLNDATNTVCTDLELSAGVQATVAHLVGPGDMLVATIEAPGKNDTSNDSADCDSIPDAQLDAIKADPGRLQGPRRGNRRRSDRHAAQGNVTKRKGPAVCPPGLS